MQISTSKTDSFGTVKITLPHVSMINGPRPQPAENSSLPVTIVPAEAVSKIVLVGLDDQGKAHASWFGKEEADAATLAADLMGFVTIDASTPELSALASVLPRGKLFESGKAFVPFVKRSVYEQLAAHLDDDYLTAAAARVSAAQASAADYAKASQGEAPARKPGDWSKLIVGDLVLAADDPAEGWFDAIVTEVYNGDEVRLRWRDYPELEIFSRKITDIALLHPQYVGG